MDGDGNTDFRLDADRDFRSGGTPINYTTTSSGAYVPTDYTYFASASASVRIASNGEGGRGLVRTGSGAGDFKNLVAGFAIGPTLASGYNFGPSGRSDRQIVYSGTGIFTSNNTSLPSAGALYGSLYVNVASYFQNGTKGNNFIGFRFDISGATHYGWAELFIEDGGAGDATAVTITRWAYESTANCGLDVGQTSGDNCTTDIPNPGTLALLAAGAAGLRRWRGKAKAA